jgi:hypothetical protein
VPGEICVNCDYLGDGIDPRCVPDPDADLEGYEAATASCALVQKWAACDGAEDCPADEYCVYDQTRESFRWGACTPTFDPCTSQTACTLCNADGDCPFGFACDTLEIVGLGYVKGCRLVR